MATFRWSTTAPTCWTSSGSQPPKTWDEYLEVAAAAHGKDMNGDGEGDFGSCMFKKRNAQSFYAIMTIAAPYLQSKGTGQGIFFDTEDMTPLVNNKAWAKAFEFYKESGKYGPPEELNHDIGDTRAAMMSGRCALAIDWGDIGPLSIDETTSKVKDLVGAVISPGSTQVLDRETGELVDCTPELCPYAVDGINHAPFAAFGGWSGAINANSDPKVIEAAYGFLSYMNQPAQSNVDVTHRLDRLQPLSRLAVRERRSVGRGRLLAGVRRELSGRDRRQPEQPEHGLGPAHPGHPALRGHRARPRAGALPRGRDHASSRRSQNVEDGWEEITEEFGRDEQLELYKASLGITN